MKNTVTWVLIADGTQARVIENTGPGKGLKQVRGMDWTIGSVSAQDIVSDRPGRSHASAGHGRSAMEPRTDPIDHRETEFLKSLADMLDHHQQQGHFDRLVVAAGPDALGDIRKAISPSVRKSIVAELNKDLTNLPTAQLNQHFDGIIVT